jgi:hypothetical protein
MSFRLYRPANVFQLELPSNLEFVGAPITIGITNDYKGEPMRGAYLLRIGSEMRGKEMGWPFQVARVRVDLVFWEEPGEAASELALPTSLDLAGFTRAEFGLIGSWGPQDPQKDGPLWSIRGRIDSLMPIPTADAIPAGSASPPPDSPPADAPATPSAASTVPGVARASESFGSDPPILEARVDPLRANLLGVRRREGATTLRPAITGRSGERLPSSR